MDDEGRRWMTRNSKQQQFRAEKEARGDMPWERGWCGEVRDTGRRVGSGAIFKKSHDASDYYLSNDPHLQVLETRAVPLEKLINGIRSSWWKVANF